MKAKSSLAILGCVLLFLPVLLHAQVPQLINYQGRVAVGAVNFDGSGQFKFALVDATGATTFWSNDGTSTAGSEPTAGVSLPVTKGLYSVLLGDTAVGAGMAAIPLGVFNNPDVRLRVGFNDGTQGWQLLTPDQRIAAVGYAIMAGNVADGAITSAKIANGAVGSPQIASSAVGGTQLADSSVTAAKIASSQVVRNVNGLTDAVTLAPGANITITPLGDSLTIASSGGVFSLNGTDAYYNGGNVGIGTTAPQSRLEVQTPNDNYGITYTDGTTRLNTYINSFLGGAGGIGTQSNHPLFFYAGNAPRMIINTFGQVGIGTTTPFARLHLANASDSGSGLLVAATEGDQTALYYSPNTGVVFDSYRPFDGRRLPIFLQPSGGNVGVGTTAPAHRLSVIGGPAWTANAWAGAMELGNASAIAWRANAGGQRFGIGQSTGGLYFFRSASDPGTTGSPSNYNLLLSDIGSVVIAPGATPPTPGMALEVNGSTLLTTGGSGGKIQFGTPSAETGMSISGNASNSRADVRFDGSTLKLLVAGSGSVPPSTNGIAINTSGNVGIGTASVTQAKLQVDGGALNGVYGSSSFKGVWGVSTGTNAVGVYGQGSGAGGYGLYGLADGSNGFGIYAKGPRYAGYFDGNVSVVGTLTKGSGSFKIDHPLDPENKYLYHSFVESPDMMNIYNGNITTNEKGEATIILPAYFEALNRDFRYQLTVIGQFAQAIVASEIQDKRFGIRTDKPNVKVSWQVTGVRQDAWANAHRIPLEEEKPASERGSYLHPEAFGQPAEKSVEWALHPKEMRERKADEEAGK